MLDERLLQCAEFVSGKGIAVDVGTDHAYLPVYLIKNKICKKAIAGDLRDGPLASAKEHIKSMGFDKEILAIKSDGIKDIDLTDVSDIIIAGMGGELIARILEDEPKVRDKKINLILQPMSKETELIKYLFDNGYIIKSEKGVYSYPFNYRVINAEFDGKKRDYEEFDLIVGKLDFKRQLDCDYLAKKCEILQSVADNMKKSKSKISEAEEKEKLAQQILDLIK